MLVDAAMQHPKALEHESKTTQNPARQKVQMLC